MKLECLLAVIRNCMNSLQGLALLQHQLLLRARTDAERSEADEEG